MSSAPLFLLALSRVKGVSRKRLYEYWQETDGNPDALASYRQQWGIANLVEQYTQALPKTKKEIHAATQRGISVTSWGLPDYPVALLNDPHPPPPVLFYQGQPITPHEPVVAIVGTRRASPYGLDFARELAAELARHNIVVVSGLALGIDGAAHQGALRAPNGRTVAILGSGHERLHPASHTNLAKNILQQNGAVYSLWPPAYTAQRYTFLERNSVITGLAQVLVIVEAGAPSGALNSAEHALRQGRDIYVMPGRPDDPRVQGNLRLLRDGAHVLTGAQDILEAYSLASQIITPTFTYDVSRMLDSHGELSLDDLQRHLQLGVAETLEQLAFAELNGEVRRTRNGTYSAVKGGGKLHV